MPTVKLNRKVFENLVGKKLPLEKLKERISYLGTDLESIDDEEITVEIFPNRPDMLSEQGFARAFSSFIGEKTGLRKYKVNKSNYKIIVDKSVTMRPYTVCAVVKNLKFDDERIRESMQVQEKLATTHGRNRKKSAYGLYPSQKINFPVTYIAKDPKGVMFKPLGFDKFIPADKVEEEHQTGQKYKQVAEGWKKYPFFIDAKDNVMCMLPFTNSDDTGKIDESTTEVFIECTGNDFNNVNIALNILATMLADMGGDIYSVEMVYPDKTIHTPLLEPKEMKIDREYINRLLGLNLSEKEIKNLLERMGLGYEKGKALIPAFRADILHQADLAEDVAIAYGYENIPEVIPEVATIGKEKPFFIFKRKITDMLIGLGFIECKTYHITNKEAQGKLMNTSIDTIDLANALNEEFDVLAAWNIPLLLEVLKNNKHHEYPQNIFSFGTVFKKDKKEETGILEQERLACVLCHDGTDYTRIRQVLDYVMRMIGKDYIIQKVEHPSFIKGRVGRVIVKGKKVAFIGEIHPQVLENWELSVPVSAFELNISELFTL